MKRLYIVRGLLGSGKSTYARSVAPLVVEPDMFRYNEKNEYVFDSGRNDAVNRKAYRLCHYAMTALEMPAIAFTAAFSRIDRFKSYIAMARNHGYAVTVVECTDDYGNTHNVPEKVVAEMRRNYEPFDAELANQEGVSLWRIARGEKTELYAPKGDN